MNRTGVNPGSRGGGGARIRLRSSLPCLCLCVYLLRNGADFISAARHACTLSTSGNNKNKITVRRFSCCTFPFPLGPQKCCFYEPVSFHSLQFNQRPARSTSQLNGGSAAAQTSIHAHTQTHTHFCWILGGSLERPPAKRQLMCMIVV